MRRLVAVITTPASHILKPRPPQGLATRPAHPHARLYKYRRIGRSLARVEAPCSPTVPLSTSEPACCVTPLHVIASGQTLRTAARSAVAPAPAPAPPKPPVEPARAALRLSSPATSSPAARPRPIFGRRRQRCAPRNALIGASVQTDVVLLSARGLSCVTQRFPALSLLWNIHRRRCCND